MDKNLEKLKEIILAAADSKDPNSLNEELSKLSKSLNESDSKLNAKLQNEKLMEFYKIPFNFVNKSNNPDPEYATAGSSGFDLRASLEQPMTLPAGNKTIVSTGLFFEIPNNFEIQIRPRSGLAAKNGVTVLNTPGTIDADYRGEIKVILINHGHEPFQINNGDRIAQAVIASVISKNFVNLKKVDVISSDTERGAGGFGSTGLL